MRCPECNAKIMYLEANYQIFVTYSVKLDSYDDLFEFNRDEYDSEELINYSCPQCFEPIATSHDEVVTFMKKEKNNEDDV